MPTPTDWRRLYLNLLAHAGTAFNALDGGPCGTSAAPICDGCECDWSAALEELGLGLGREPNYGRGLAKKVHVTKAMEMRRLLREALTREEAIIAGKIVEVTAVDAPGGWLERARVALGEAE